MKRNLLILVLLAGAGCCPFNVPLEKALYRRDYAKMKSLIAAGADVNGADSTGNTPLTLAANFGNTNAVEILLAAGADPNKPGHFTAMTPLIWATMFSHTNVIALLLRHGAHVDGKGASGETALHYTVSVTPDPLISSLQALIAGGANVNATNNSGWTPLRYARHHGYAEAARLLMQAGAKPPTYRPLSPETVAELNRLRGFVAGLATEHHLARVPANPDADFDVLQQIIARQLIPKDATWQIKALDVVFCDTLIVREPKLQWVEVSDAGHVAPVLMYGDTAFEVFEPTGHSMLALHLARGTKTPVVRALAANSLAQLAAGPKALPR